MKLSYDGKGINEASASFCPRIATFTSEDDAKAFGHLFESSPDVLQALQELLNRCESHGCEKWFPHVIDRARLSILKAKGGAR